MRRLTGKVGLTFLLLVVTSLVAKPQVAVGVSIAGNFSQVSYKNSQGVSNKDLRGLPGVAFNFLGQLPFPITHTANTTLASLIELTVGYKTSSFKDIRSNLLTTWSLNFLTTGVGYSYARPTKKRVAPCVSLMIGYDYLLSGTQSRGFEQYDLTAGLKRSNFTFSPGAGINYKISDSNNCGLNLSYSRGLLNLEADPGQKAMLHSVQLSAFLFFSLEK